MSAPARALAVAALPLVALGALLSGAGAAAGAAACVIAVAAAIDRRHLAMSLWFGVAVALSAQALLAAPFFLAAAIRHRAGLRDWLAAPAAWFVMTLPWLAAGWRPAGLDFSMDSAPGIWALTTVIAPVYTPQLTGLALAAALGTAAAFVARMQVTPFDRAGMIGMAGLATLLTAGLLPGMRAGDFLLSAIFTLACTIARPTRPAILAAALVHAGFFAAILGDPGFGLSAIAIGALCMIAAAWIAARPLIAPHANDNRDGSHRIPFAHGLRGTLTFDMMTAPVAAPRGSKAYVREQDA